MIRKYGLFKLQIKNQAIFSEFIGKQLFSELLLFVFAVVLCVWVEMKKDVSLDQGFSTGVPW